MSNEELEFDNAFEELAEPLMQNLFELENCIVPRHKVEDPDKACPDHECALCDMDHIMRAMRGADFPYEGIVATFVICLGFIMRDDPVIQKLYPDMGEGADKFSFRDVAMSYISTSTGLMLHATLDGKAIARGVAEAVKNVTTH